MNRYFILCLSLFLFKADLKAQLYERSGRNFGIVAGYEFTSTHDSKKGFMPGESGQAFRIGYTRSFGDFIYPELIFNYKMNNLSVKSTDTLGNEFSNTMSISGSALQIPVLIQIPFVSIPLGKSKKRECSYLNTNFRVGPEYSFNMRVKSNQPFSSHHEWALQTAFGFNISKSGGTHRRMAWDVQWHFVWRKSFNHLGTLDGFTGSQKFYNNYLGLTVTIIRYATTSFL